MKSVDEAIRSLDTGIFAAIPSETTDEDRTSLLVLQNCARNLGGYACLEIGSFAGGTIQPFYADPLCRRIYSIDKRPDFVPDERGRQWYHYDRQVNSTDTMLANLSRAFPGADGAKMRTFDSGAEDVDIDAIDDPPRFCFIDAEHTNAAVYSDFRFCLDVAHRDAIIAFHDAGIVFGGLRKVQLLLRDGSVPFRGFKLGGSVYAILLNDAVAQHSAELAAIAIDEDDYFAKAERDLHEAQKEYRSFGKTTIKQGLVRFPVLFKLLRSVKRFFVRPTRRQI